MNAWFMLKADVQPALSVIWKHSKIYRKNKNKNQSGKEIQSEF